VGSPTPTSPGTNNGSTTERRASKKYKPAKTASKNAINEKINTIIVF
jgi:hypothetical protein